MNLISCMRRENPDLCSYCIAYSRGRFEEYVLTIYHISGTVSY